MTAWQQWQGTAVSISLRICRSCRCLPPLPPLWLAWAWGGGVLMPLHLGRVAMCAVHTKSLACTQRCNGKHSCRRPEPLLCCTHWSRLALSWRNVCCATFLLQRISHSTSLPARNYIVSGRISPCQRYQMMYAVPPCEISLTGRTLARPSCTHFSSDFPAAPQHACCTAISSHPVMDLPSFISDRCHTTCCLQSMT